MQDLLRRRNSDSERFWISVDSGPILVSRIGTRIDVRIFSESTCPDRFDFPYYRCALGVHGQSSSGMPPVETSQKELWPFQMVIAALYGGDGTSSRPKNPRGSGPVKPGRRAGDASVCVFGQSAEIDDPENSHVRCKVEGYETKWAGHATLAFIRGQLAVGKDGEVGDDWSNRGLEDV
ncbi:hypothetical protein DFH09DRAFT_1103620 [Mycena vulgaris]|nr:hypothetical protein DFH09DRAFT_1103620 [Mycena vulgaris]